VSSTVTIQTAVYTWSRDEHVPTPGHRLRPWYSRAAR
jgi:hypothetical protein